MNFADVPNYVKKIKAAILLKMQTPIELFLILQALWGKLVKTKTDFQANEK